MTSSDDRRASALKRWKRPDNVTVVESRPRPITQTSLMLAAALAGLAPKDAGQYTLTASIVRNSDGSIDITTLSLREGSP